ncbi:MAG: hypothetical protein ACJ77Z_19300 [Thermoleophilaceae bacterium]
MTLEHVERLALAARHLQGIAEVGEPSPPAGLAARGALEGEPAEQREHSAQRQDDADRYALAAGAIGRLVALLVRGQHPLARPERIGRVAIGGGLDLAGHPDSTRHHRDRDEKHDSYERVARHPCRQARLYIPPMR